MQYDNDEDQEFFNDESHTPAFIAFAVCASVGFGIIFFCGMAAFAEWIRSH